MAWHVFEKLLEGVANYSTFIGKLWITFFFIFRIIIVASIGDTVYNDEQSQFICNTLQPGCSNVCFNRFSPISQIRFWAVQILFVGMPGVVFVVFALHKTSSQSAKNEKQEEIKNQRYDEYDKRSFRRRKKQRAYANGKRNTEVKLSSNSSGLPLYDDLSRGHSKNGVVKAKDSKNSATYDGNSSFHLPVQIVNIDPERRQVKMKTVYNKDGKSEVMKTRAISLAYFTQTVITIVIEAVFVFLQYDMYKFQVKELYLCDADPCPQKVECYVSRPQEKTIFLLFMYALSSLSIFINILELLHLMRKYFIKGQVMKHNSYLTGLPSRRHDNTTRRRGMAVSAYPTIGPYPRKHGNSLTDSDDNDSIESDYSFYER